MDLINLFLTSFWVNLTIFPLNAYSCFSQSLFLPLEKLVFTVLLIYSFFKYKIYWSESNHMRKSSDMLILIIFHSIVIRSSTWTNLDFFTTMGRTRTLDLATLDEQWYNDFAMNV